MLVLDMEPNSPTSQKALTCHFTGLKRTGKSCRLRWVNYLHPGLKRGKMTPHEENLVRELHSKWGNSWSRIARKLPGRTDNEIKNYWRTQTRKEAQDKIEDCVVRSGEGKMGLEVGESSEVYSMDEIWKDIELSEESRKLSSTAWDFCAMGSLWSMENEEESNVPDTSHGW